MKLSASEQLETLLEVFRSGWIEDFTAAIDGGANVGAWAIEMAVRFEAVYAFEPAPDTAATLIANTKHFANVYVRQMALLDRACGVEVLAPAKREAKHRSRYVAPSAAGPVRAMTIDSLGLRNCGLIKLDLEGAEHAALMGAVKTLNRCRPVVIVELERARNGFQTSEEETINLLNSLGYSAMMERAPDTVFVPVDRL